MLQRDFVVLDPSIEVAQVDEERGVILSLNHRQFTALDHGAEALRAAPKVFGGQLQPQQTWRNGRILGHSLGRGLAETSVPSGFPFFGV